MNTLKQRSWTNEGKYRLAALLILTLVYQHLFNIPRFVFISLIGLALWLPNPFIKRLSYYSSWMLSAVWLVGITNAEPATRSIALIGTVVALLILWLLHCFIRCVNHILS